MKDYIRLMRPVHWIKNGLILLPLFCSGRLMEAALLGKALLGFLAFSLLSSAVYVLNDICDREKDRLSPSKRGRPIASGRVSVSAAKILCACLAALGIACCVPAAGSHPLTYGIFLLYFLMNLGYSMGLKNVPLLDVTILAAGFVLRLVFGGMVTDIPPSGWLCLCVISASFYLGLGKRRGELLYQPKEVRGVLRYYNAEFLDKYMHMFMTLTIVFYALWSVGDMTTGSLRFVWTVPLVILIFMKYGIDVDEKQNGDPVEVLLHDPALLILGAVFLLALLAGIYL